ncbi:MAG: hypothetical protein QGD94_07905 [Planctomycetia bacterium]|nr:hypothetical protein [Planctomycetia bacterium]
MPRLATLSFLTMVVLATGCGTQEMLLGTEGKHLFIVSDALALPGEEIVLQARLRSGDLLKAQPGRIVRFSLNGRLFKIAETDGDGAATVSFTPEAAGDYRFSVEMAPTGFSDAPPGARQLLVACRKAEAPLMVVDMDKTLVASGFDAVLIGNPKPMQMSSAVMNRLARKYTVVYLTHRPDYFGPKSSAWLREHGYPVGPLLLSDITGFLKGSGAFKSRMLEELRRRFKNIPIGIGDKISDAQAYHDNGMRAFLIISVSEATGSAALTALADALGSLPEAVQVVTDWSQIEKGIFDGASFPRSKAQEQLRKLAKDAEGAGAPTE